MREKQYELVKTLLDTSTWIQANNLAILLGVSSRSIKNYIQSINEMYPQTILSSKNGYRINIEKGQAVLLSRKTSVPQTSNDRVTYIINKLVKTNDGYDSYTFCDELFISLSTLKNELVKVKRKVSKFDLTLQFKSDILNLVGLEKNKRKLVSSILYDESSVNFVNLKTVQKNFPSVDIEYIKDVVTTTFTTYHYFVNDYSLINLVLHITIAIDRIKNNYASSKTNEQRAIMKLHEYELAQVVSHQLEDHFSIIYSEEEVYELALLLISHANTLDYNVVNATSLETLIGKDCFTLVNELVNDVNAFYYINLSEPEFLTRFALHIRSLLIRSTYNYSSKNPLATGIQLTCPFIYDAAVSLCSTIEERTQLHINEDEIAYIAFHLGSALETQKAIHEKIKVILYCPNYYDMSMRLVDAINTNFSNSILIKNVIANESELDHLTNYDLIISTIPIHSILPIPTILISFLLNQNDKNRVRNKIDEIKIEKKKQLLRKHLYHIMKAELFEKNEVLESIHDTIPYMCKKLVDLNCIDEHFEDEVWAREKMASTAFTTFAIPHAIKMNAKKTSMSIILSEKGIQWNHQVVHLVIMLTFNKQERYIFNEIFDTLTMLLTDSNITRRLIHATSYESFIDIVVSFICEP